MALPIFAKKEDVPKAFEGEYEEREGKWHPKESEDVATLRTALEKVRTEKKDVEAERKATEEKRKELERQLAAAGSGDEKDKVTKALKKFDDDKAEIERKAKEREDALNAELRTLKLTDKVKAAFLAAGGLSERAEKAVKDTEGRLDLDGDRIVIKDAKGTVTTQTVEDFFSKTYKTEMPEWFAGTKAAGGGAKGGASKHPQGDTGAAADAELVTKDPMALLVKANAAAEK